MARRKIDDYDIPPDDLPEIPQETKRELEAKKLKEQIKSLELKNKILEKELTERLEPIKKGKRGPKERYNILFHPKLAELFYSAGGIDREFADFLNITEMTLNNWKKRYKEFGASIKLGKLDPDSKIVSALYRSALAGSNTAQIFWLKNRRPVDWREKQDIEVTGKDGGAILTKRERNKEIDEMIEKRNKLLKRKNEK